MRGAHGRRGGITARGRRWGTARGKERPGEGMDEAGWGAQPEGEGRREGLRLSGDGIAATLPLPASGPGQWAGLSPVVHRSFGQPYILFLPLLRHILIFLNHFHPQMPKLIHSWQVGHRAYVHTVLSA